MGCLIPDVLTSHQKCSNGDKNIFEAVCTVRDQIAISNHEQTGGVLVALDLSHAFDRVNHTFLLNTLRSMRFNSSFVDLQANLMMAASSKILINGKCTEAFEIRRSVRQGDPLSMLFFVIYLQPLLEKLSQICNSPGEFVIAYADDITIIVRDVYKLPIIKECLESFEAVAGAKLNVQKTEAMEIGPQHAFWNDFEKKDMVKVLGVVFHSNMKDTIEANMAKLYRNINAMLITHRYRLLNLKQKVFLLNTYICSKLASILPLTNKYIAMITRQIGYFLWSNIPAQRVRLTDMVRSKRKGGLGLHSPDLKSKSLLVNRYLRLENRIPSVNQYIILDNMPQALTHLNTIKRGLVEINAELRAAPGAKRIYEHFGDALPPVRIVSRINKRWNRIWRNINSRGLDSEEKSMYFLLVHGKLNHNALFYEQERRDDPNCNVCNTVEDIDHKFAGCSAVAPMWAVFQQYIRSSNSFEKFHYPEEISGSVNSRKV